MQFLRAAAILAVAAILVAGWTLVQPAIQPARWLASTLRAPTFYVRPGGHDTASGTSPATAWRTLARASRAILRPGDKLLLLGGHAYYGELVIGPKDAGRPGKPILVSSYGRGRATISSAKSGITIYNTRGVGIRNIVITGNHAMRPGTAGIQMYSSRLSGPLGHVYISKVNISRFGFGIAIGAAHDGGGFRNVQIRQASLHANLDAGLVSYGPDFNAAAPGYAHRDIYVSHVKVFGNLGDHHEVAHNSGSGIELGAVNGATVTRSVAYGNGGAGGATTEGPIGIWAYDSTRVAFTHDVSHNNRSNNARDGGGFGLDRECSHSVMEYNLSYDNHGAGFLLFSAKEAAGASNNNVVRFNISYDDARGGKLVTGGMAAGGKVRNSLFYQNTIVIARGNTQPAFKVTGLEHNVKVLNNILAGGSQKVVVAAEPMTTDNIAFAGNDYVAPSGVRVFQWGTHHQYESLSAWRLATGEEHKILGRDTGLTAWPWFVGPLSGTRGGAGFRLRRDSKLRRAGLNLFRNFGIRPGPVTFAGSPYHLRAPNIGAQ
jgi:hypothetical protein